MKRLIAVAVAAAVGSAAAFETPGYSQVFTATGTCVMDYDFTNGFVVDIKDCPTHYFHVSVSDDYVVGQGYFEIASYSGGTFGISYDKNVVALYEGNSSSPWNAWGSINPDGTGAFWFMNSGYAVRAPYSPDPWFSFAAPFDQDWSWVLFAENGIGGQTWFGDSFVWDINASVARVPAIINEPGTLGLLAAGLWGLGWRRRMT